MANYNPKNIDLPPDDDDDIALWLSEVRETDAPREEFVASLGDRLDAELQTVLDFRRPAAGGPASNSHAPQPNASASPPTSRWLTSRPVRLASAVAMTGSLVVAALVWSMQPTYSWASMVQALEEQPWVQPEFVGESDQLGWLSGVHEVMVVRSGGALARLDADAGFRGQDPEAARDVSHTPSAARSPATIEEMLLRFILLQGRGEAHPPEKLSQPDGTITVTEQTWRTINEAGRSLIELDVRLRWGGRNPITAHLILHLDPETRLPLRCQVLNLHREGEQPAGKTHQIRFEYPQTVPREIEELEPRDHLIAQVDLLEDPLEPLLAREDETVLASRPEPTIAIHPQEETIFNTVAPPTGPIANTAEEMSRLIDESLADCWQRNGIQPVGPCDDSEFVRRAYLDLTGRVPTVSEVRAFQRDSTAARERLVDDILASRDHATHLASVWRTILLPPEVDLSQFGGTARFEDWLTERFRANVAYDELVRELLLAEGRVNESGPVLFYTALRLEPEQLAARTARAFLGIRLECAQCHDHRFDERWKQTDFWGYAAFFAQISRPQGKMETISPVLRVRDSDRGDVALPDTDEIIPPKFLLGSPAVNQPQSPSRRRQLADWMTAAENSQFARATVNRAWAHLFGRGLIDPVDDMRADNPSVCPELLDRLAQSFTATGFDLRTLIRAIVLSDAYQLSSRSADDDPARLLHFAQMNIKTFTAEQLYDSIAVSTRRESLGTPGEGLVRVGNESRESFLEQFRAPAGQATDFQGGIPQALTLMNGRLVQSATDLRSSGILRSLEAPFFTDEQRVETLFLATLSRVPDDAERTSAMEYVQSADGETGQRLGDLLWALLNSAEFTLNH